jgi:hypothetical protein
VVAAIGAAAIGQVLDGGLLIVIFATSGALEALATARTEDSVRGLLDLAPQTATQLTEQGDEQTVQAVELAVGDVVLVRPGERIAADGAVVAGAGEVDQGTITGEPLPVDKTVGDEVFAGTPNGTGSLRVRVDRRAEDSGSPESRRSSRKRAEPKPAPSCSSRRSNSATRSAWSPPPSPCSSSRCYGEIRCGTRCRGDDVHDRRLAVRGGARHNAAPDHRQRPPRPVGPTISFVIPAVRPDSSGGHQ